MPVSGGRASQAEQRAQTLRWKHACHAGGMVRQEARSCGTLRALTTAWAFALGETGSWQEVGNSALT